MSLIWGGVDPHDYNNPRGTVSNENQITINGERHLMAARTTLYEVVLTLGLEPERVAIELNRSIVKRDLWKATPVGSGAEIEIVQFVGGG